MSRFRWNRLGAVAAWTAAIHLLAGLAMAAVLRYGLDTNIDLSSRLAFVSDHEAFWIAAWLTWMLAAVSVLFFFAAAASAHWCGRSSVLVSGVLCVAVAVPMDLAAESIELGVLPDLARRAISDSPGHPASNPAAVEFVRLHRVAAILTGFTANGLYSLAALALTLATRSTYSRWMTAAGMTVAVSGLLLSVAALRDSARGMVWSNVVLVPSIVAWITGICIDARRRASREAGT